MKVDGWVDMSKNQENQSLPLFYKQLVALNSSVHASSRARTTDKASWLAKQHAVPLMTDEFAKGSAAIRSFFPQRKGLFLWL